MWGLCLRIVTLLGAVILVSGCAAVSNLKGATLIYSREMTDREGKDTVFRAYRIADPTLFEAEHINETVNYAGANLEFERPTYLLVFQSLPGPSISHTADLSLALPLLTRELCGDRPVVKAERELDWGSGNRKIYVECEPLAAGQEVASRDTAAVGSVPSAGSGSAAVPDPDYVLNYRVLYDFNGDAPNARVSILPDGTRIVEIQKRVSPQGVRDL